VGFTNTPEEGSNLSENNSAKDEAAKLITGNGNAAKSLEESNVNNNSTDNSKLTDQLPILKLKKREKSKNSTSIKITIKKKSNFSFPKNFYPLSASATDDLREKIACIVNPKTQVNNLLSNGDSPAGKPGSQVTIKSLDTVQNGNLEVIDL